MRTRRAALGLAAVAAALIAVAPAASHAATISGKVVAKAKKFQKNVVVYVEKATAKGPAHLTAEMHQKNQTFQPFVLPVVKGTTVTFFNEDNTKHNVFSPDGGGYDLGTWTKGQTRTHKFDKLGVYTQLCRMHPSMLAYIVVLQNPYYAVTTPSGEFTIKNVPDGSYTLKVWSERMKAAPVPVKVHGGGAAGVTITLTH